MTENAKPKPIAVRLSPEHLARADEWGAEHGIKTRHGAIVAAFEKGCGFRPKAKKGKKKPVPKSPKAALQHAEDAAAHLGKPKPPTIQDIVETTARLRPSPPRSRWDLSDVHLGPVTRTPGSMLKGPKKK